MMFLPCYFFPKSLQRQVNKTQVYGGKSSIRGATSGTASSVAFTPLQVCVCVFVRIVFFTCVTIDACLFQGLEIVNPMAAEKKVQEVTSNARFYLPFSCHKVFLTIQQKSI